jgi:DNA-binding NtrC family response regulator
MTTILLVEDDPLEARRIMPLLEQEFGEVRRAIDAAEALSAIEYPDFAGKVRLVISGHQLKGIGRPAFVAELHERMPYLPVLVLGTPGESASDYSSEHVAFLPGPVLPGQILSLARRLLTGQQEAIVA